MKRIVLKSFRGRKKELRISIIMLALIYMCGMMTILFQESFYRSRESLRYDRYGEWTGAIFGAGEGAEQILKETDSVERIGKIIMLGATWQGGERLGETGYVDKTAEGLSRIQMAEGKLPASNTEAALSETVIDRLPEQIEVGDTIAFSLSEGGKAKEYTLSGIVKPWGNEWDTEKYALPSVILGGGKETQTTGETYLLFRDTNTEGTDGIQGQIEDLEAGTYVYNEKAYPEDKSPIDVFFEDGQFVYFLVLIAAILTGYLIMLILKSRRYSLMVLRGMGADIKEILQIVFWEALFIWGAAFLTGIILSIAGTAAALLGARQILNMPIQVEVRIEYILEYIGCVTAVYFVSNLLIALTAIGSQIRTTFKADSGLLDRSTPPRLKEPRELTFFTCLKRKWTFYGRIYIGRFAVSIIVMTVSAICLQHFIEAKEEYEFWKDAVEYAYAYTADTPENGMTEEEIAGVWNIDGVESVEREVYINTSTMLERNSEIKVEFPGFRDSEYVRTQRKYNQKGLGLPFDKKGDYFSLLELQGISPQDERKTSYYEKHMDEGDFDETLFEEGKECILVLPPYQVRDLGGGKEVTYVTSEELEEGGDVYTYEGGEKGIAPGDVVKVSTPWGTKEIAVGGIVTSPAGEGYVHSDVIAVSEQFLFDLCGFEEDRYTAVTINLDETADTASTGLAVESYFESIGKQSNLTDRSSVMRGFAETSLFEGTQYLFVLTAVWLIYMLVMYQGNMAYLKNEGKRIGVFRSLGMDKKTLKLRYLSENLVEGAAVIALSFAIVTGEFLIRLRKSAPYDSARMLFQVLRENPEKTQLFMSALLIGVTVFLGVSMATLYGPLGKLTRKNITESLSGDGGND